MTGDGGQQGRNGRPSRSSARLSLGPEDSWRSWSQLPDGASTESAETDDGSDLSIEELEARLGGSMLIVAKSDTAPEPAPTVGDAVPEAAPTDVTTPSALPRRARPNLPPPGPATTDPSVTEPVVKASEAEADAALAAELPEMEESFGRRAPVAEPPAVTAPAVASDAPPTPRPANRRQRPEPVRTQPPLAIFAPSEPAGVPSSTAATAATVPDDTEADVALVLTSDPEIDKQAARRRPPLPSKNRKNLGRPAVGGSWAETADGERSVSGIVADALGLLEARVSRQAQETESMLAELEVRYAEELARLDGRVHRELRSLEGGVPKSFEDRVTASFMQLVERLERLERRPALPATARIEGETDEVQVAPASDAALAFVADQNAELAATVEALAQRQATAAAEHQAAADRQAELASAQQLVTAGQQHVTETLETVFARVAELSSRVEAATASFPSVEQRVTQLEHHTSEALVLLQARVDDLVDRFPVVEGAVEALTRQGDAVELLRGTVEQFRAALDHDISQVRDRLGDVDSMRSQVAEVQERSARFGTELAAAAERLDGVDGRLDQGVAATDAVRQEFDRLQAEADRRASAAEARLLDLEDVIGGEVGVDRNLLLDRIEEMERGLYELDPDQFVKRDELSGLPHRSDDSSGPGPDR